MRPVRESGGHYKLVPYCLTEKGKNAMEQKQHSNP
jgi:hypothetical protein